MLKISKIMIKSLFNYSLHSHPEIGNFRVWQLYPLKRNLVPTFEERRSKEEGDKQKYCSQIR
jgi:hypothetical protein